jgi:hypothetical protein
MITITMMITANIMPVSTMSAPARPARWRFDAFALTFAPRFSLIWGGVTEEMEMPNG